MWKGTPARFERMNAIPDPTEPSNNSTLKRERGHGAREPIAKGVIRHIGEPVVRQVKEGLIGCALRNNPNQTRAATWMLAQQKLLSTHARCHRGISVATPSGKLADYALPLN
jgi:hypothetical protein